MEDIDHNIRTLPLGFSFIYHDIACQFILVKGKSRRFNLLGVNATCKVQSTVSSTEAGRSTYMLYNFVRVVNYFFQKHEKHIDITELFLLHKLPQKNINSVSTS